MTAPRSDPAPTPPDQEILQRQVIVTAWRERRNFKGATNLPLEIPDTLQSICTIDTEVSEERALPPRFDT